MASDYNLTGSETVRAVPPGTSSDGPGAPAPVALCLEQICKLYPGVSAMSGLDLTVLEGEIHGLVGENGAGKSTVLKILAGAHRATSGTIAVFGEPADFHAPKDAQRRGIATVYQELTVLPAMSALDNVFLGQELRRGLVSSRGAMEKRYRALCDRLGVSIDPNIRADELSIADQQVLEILRALQADARIILFDEPTASLAVHEREALHKTMRHLRDQGVTQMLVSHDLDEVLDLTDTVTVFRDGRKVATEPTPGWTKRSLVQAMFGDREIMHIERTRTSGDVLLHADAISVPGFVSNAELTVHAGEILGVAGLVGSGRTELLRALAGADPTSAGRLSIRGTEVPWPRSPRQALRHGIGLAPEDRKGQGLVLTMPTYSNINLTGLAETSRAGVTSRTAQLGRADALGAKMHLAPAAIRRSVRTLSGGNQQKAVLAKWADCGLSVMLVDEPTRGIDVAAKAEVFALLDELAAGGMAIVMVSSELEELADHCDRVVVLARGRTLAELEGQDLKVESILNTIFEVERENA